MNRVEFIKDLQNELKSVPENEIADILYDCEEHFEVELSKGKSEEEIIKELGNSKSIAKTYKVSSKINKAEKNPSTKNLFRAIWSAMTLGLFNLIFILGSFILVIGFLFGLYAIAISFIVGGISSFFSIILSPFLPENIHIAVHPITSISFGTCFMSLGILLFMSSAYLTKLIYQIIIKYLRWNIDMIIT